MSEYDSVAIGSLKLKNTSKVHKKNKKNKVKDEEKQKIIENILEDANENDKLEQTQDPNAWMTKAQKKFLAQQEKRQLTRVMEKASKSHKQRVEEFNSHLENLSEHYDIPKVSWTK